MRTALFLAAGFLAGFLLALGAAVLPLDAGVPILFAFGIGWSLGACTVAFSCRRAMVLTDPHDYYSDPSVMQRRPETARNYWLSVLARNDAARRPTGIRELRS